MRLRFLFLPLALAACSSDPAPIDAGPHVDKQPDSGWPWADVVGDDRMALPDFGPRDTGTDVPAVDATEDRPTPMDVSDVPPADVAADGDDAADDLVPRDARIDRRHRAVPLVADLM